MRNDTLFWALCDLDEDLILEAKEEIAVTKKQFNPIRLALIAAAIAVLLAGAALAVYHYTRSTESLADRWALFGETEMPEVQKDYIESKSANIGESVTDQNVTITLDSVTATEKTAYLLFCIHPDPEVYGEEAETDDYMIRFLDAEIYAENPQFGRLTDHTGGGGGGDDEPDGDYWMNYEISFNSLPEGTRLNDGNTTMYMSLHSIMQMGPQGEVPEIHGTWTFEFALPASDESGTVSLEQELDFSGGVVMHISCLSVDDQGVSFTVETDNEEYVFAGSGVQAELARAAEPDQLCLTVEAVLQDGTLVPTTGSRMGHDPDSTEHSWSIDWAAPLDPAQITSLVFSDGTTEIEVPMDLTAIR